MTSPNGLTPHYGFQTWLKILLCFQGTVPNAFSGKHRFWGETGMITMMLTGINSFPLYYYGFVL